MRFEQFRLRQGNMTVAGASTEHEIMHYAMQYRQDGPVTVQRQERRSRRTTKSMWYWKRHAFFEKWPR